MNDLLCVKDILEGYPFFFYFLQLVLFSDHGQKVILRIIYILVVPFSLLRVVVDFHVEGLDHFSWYCFRR